MSSHALFIVALFLQGCVGILGDASPRKERGNGLTVRDAVRGLPTHNLGAEAPLGDPDQTSSLATVSALDRISSKNSSTVEETLQLDRPARPAGAEGPADDEGALWENFLSQALLGGAAKLDGLEADKPQRKTAHSGEGKQAKISVPPLSSAWKGLFAFLGIPAALIITFIAMGVIALVGMAAVVLAAIGLGAAVVGGLAVVIVLLGFTLYGFGSEAVSAIKRSRKRRQDARAAAALKGNDPTNPPAATSPPSKGRLPPRTAPSAPVETPPMSTASSLGSSQSQDLDDVDSGLDS